VRAGSSHDHLVGPVRPALASREDAAFHNTGNAKLELCSNHNVAGCHHAGKDHQVELLELVQWGLQ
jgi:hypothetical protein